jgi:hypothetical protein
MIRLVIRAGATLRQSESEGIERTMYRDLSHDPHAMGGIGMSRESIAPAGIGASGSLREAGLRNGGI